MQLPGYNDSSGTGGIIGLSFDMGDGKMGDRPCPDMSREERDRLQNIINSVPGCYELIDDVLISWGKGTAVHHSRRYLAQSQEKTEHENNVSKNYKRALCEHYAHKKLQAPWSLGAEFITTHFEESPFHTLETIRECMLSKPTERAWPSFFVVFLTVFLPCCLLIKFVDLPLSLEWTLADLVVIAAILNRAKPMRCSMIRWKSGDDMETLEAYCDVMGGSLFHALPKPMWVVMLLFVLLPYFLTHI